MARKLSTTLAERFWPKVNPTGFCWEWTAYIDPYGYGKIGTGLRSIGAHRASYELLIGPIPEGLVLDHLCRNTKCVNPDHLEPVTQAENMHRSWRALRTHCKNGHRFDEKARRNTDGSRRCKICARERQQRVYGYTPRVPLRDRTHCTRGHLLADGNLHEPEGRPGRCRACGREDAAAASRRKRAEMGNRDA